MRKIVQLYIITSLVFSINIFAQNFEEAELKSSLSKIFDLSKAQNYKELSSLLVIENENDVEKAVKRTAKKIKAYLNLSDSYEYASITYDKINDLPGANLNVIFKSGDQKLSISFSFIKKSNKLLLVEFK
jgi:hypothetical protein